jgi:type IV pilus assembly protein PilQ
MGPDRGAITAPPDPSNDQAQKGKHMGTRHDNLRRYGAGLILTILMAAAVAWAAEPVAGFDGAEILTPVQKRMQQKISVDFRETPIEDVLRILARQAEIDVVKSPKVTGSVTATLKDIPLGEALDNILSAHGYGYISTQNMIRVVPQEEIYQAKEKKVSRVYRVTFADVKEVEVALKKFMSETGSISSNPGTSNIIVTDMESKILAIDKFLEEIDRPTPQILVEARIYDITSTDQLDLGVEWNFGKNTNYGANGIGAIGDNSTLTYPNNNANPFITGLSSGSTNKADGMQNVFRFGILNKSVDLDALIRAEQKEITAKLLANPRIMVLDNQQATIKIVEEIPYQELTETSGGGQIGTTKFKDVGVELVVTPHLTRDNKIRLILKPKFSVRTSEVFVTANSIPQPVVAKRETDTVALIEDNQTVVIGGLRKQDIQQEIKKIPLLGDIPLLGALFRFEGESTVNSELVVFITPHLIMDKPVMTERELIRLKETDLPMPRAESTRLGKGQAPQVEKESPK